MLHYKTNGSLKNRAHFELAINGKREEMWNGHADTGTLRLAWSPDGARVGVVVNPTKGTNGQVDSDFFLLLKRP